MVANSIPKHTTAMTVKCHLMTTKTPPPPPDTWIQATERLESEKKPTYKLSTHLSSSLEHTAPCFHEVKVLEKN